ncbi:MAG: acyl-CoA dehydrogenase family protein [Acidimicrobiales bacterium]|nr:acyl-CoA dehydrogenase family protein [Acidimicrobiales bacterium]
MHRRVFDEEHDQFRDAVRAVVAREIEPRAEEFRSSAAIDRSAWRALGSQGFVGFMVPEEYGGAGVDDFRYNAVLGEELARVGLAFASSVGINTDVIAPYLLELTTPGQKQRWLPRFAAGELICAIGMTEPNAGSDLAALGTTAVRDGDDWILNGSKTFITNGHQADLVIVAARTTSGSRSKGISLFGVEAGMAGFERGRKLDKVGQPEADTAELYLDDVRVPEALRVGELDAGFAHMMERLPQERLSCAVACVAHAYEALDQTVAYARERSAFGQSIGSFQHNRFTLAALSTELDVTRAYVDACLEAHVAGELDGSDAAKAKYWASEVQGRVIDACVQLHGGMGYMRETPVARAWLDARVARIWAGSNEIMREVIGRTLT